MIHVRVIKKHVSMLFYSCCDHTQASTRLVGQLYARASGWLVGLVFLPWYYHSQTLTGKNDGTTTPRPRLAKMTVISALFVLMVECGEDAGKVGSDDLHSGNLQALVTGHWQYGLF